MFANESHVMLIIQPIGGATGPEPQNKIEDELLYSSFFTNVHW